MVPTPEFPEQCQGILLSSSWLCAVPGLGVPDPLPSFPASARPTWDLCPAPLAPVTIPLPRKIPPCPSAGTPPAPPGHPLGTPRRCARAAERSQSPLDLLETPGRESCKANASLHIPGPASGPRVAVFPVPPVPCHRADPAVSRHIHLPGMGSRGRGALALRKLWFCLPMEPGITPGSSCPGTTTRARRLFPPVFLGVPPSLMELKAGFICSRPCGVQGLTLGRPGSPQGSREVWICLWSWARCQQLSQPPRSWECS